MGIVCHCPNGHRVKVKDTLAGKRGLCPQCGATFSIPAVGTELAAADQPSAEPPLPMARFVPLEPSMVATLPRAMPFGTAAATAAAAAAMGPEISAAAPEPFEADAFVPSPVDAAPPPFHPAIADRPDLTWRIAYPGGEASEPVDAVTMQEWIAGGQAEGSELVWRADWAEWLPVRGVFPEFFSEA